MNSEGWDRVLCKFFSLIARCLLANLSSTALNVKSIFYMTSLLTPLLEKDATNIGQPYLCPFDTYDMKLDKVTL